MDGSISQFDNDIRRVIQRHRAENDLNYAQAIGTLYLIMAELAEEAGESSEWKEGI